MRRLLLAAASAHLAAGRVLSTEDENCCRDERLPISDAGFRSAIDLAGYGYVFTAPNALKSLSAPQALSWFALVLFTGRSLKADGSAQDLWLSVAEAATEFEFVGGSSQEELWELQDRFSLTDGEERAASVPQAETEHLHVRANRSVTTGLFAVAKGCIDKGLSKEDVFGTGPRIVPVLFAEDVFKLGAGFDDMFGNCKTKVEQVLGNSGSDELGPLSLL
ncbi:unnamed protein product [Polarella glacialis]|uniref:Uncharacterized protein n=1 Tax=Polarella glacialis TaxID=89957 RepID=A0A813G7K8_POLGL|nr:unnamed protein product [Polarella glacialis]